MTGLTQWHALSKMVGHRPGGVVVLWPIGKIIVPTEDVPLRYPHLR
jgi:hypothetical protein